VTKIVNEPAPEKKDYVSRETLPDLQKFKKSKIKNLIL